MQSIKVHSVSGNVRPVNAISVWDASSTGKRPVDSIPVWNETNAGDKPLNAIQVKLVDEEPGAIKVWFKGGEGPVDPYNPLGLPPYTIRFKYKQGTTPTFPIGTCVLVDAGQNIWDLTYENSNWNGLFDSDINLLEVIGGNTTNITYMSSMFAYCSSLTTVSLFDTSNVTDMSRMLAGCDSLSTIALFDTSNVTDMSVMFSYCTSLTSIPLFNTSNVEDMLEAFSNCTNVESGALALYQQLSTQTNPPSRHEDTFTNCGRDTQTGAAELAQIPTDWGGTKTN